MFLTQEDNLTLEEVLEICKTIKEKNIEININRPKNLGFIQKFNLNANDVIRIVRDLNKEDYSAGPVEDTNPNFKHPFWIFIKYVNDIKVVVYIKIKIFNHKRKINVFSIHEEGEY